MKLAEVLSGPEKWVQCGLPMEGKVRDAVCLFNALFHIATETAELVREQNRLLSLIECADLQEGFAWNDDPARTWDEVALVVDAYDRDRMLRP